MQHFHYLHYPSQRVRQKKGNTPKSTKTILSIVFENKALLLAQKSETVQYTANYHDTGRISILFQKVMCPNQIFEKKPIKLEFLTSGK